MMTMEWRFFLIAGICGGYTTFSTFSYEGIELLRQGRILALLVIRIFKCSPWYAGNSWRIVNYKIMITNK